MQALCLMLLLVGVVIGGPVSTQTNIDSSIVDDLGSVGVLDGDENPALGDVNQALGNSGLALEDTDLFGDTGLDLGDDSLALADMEEVFLDDELVPLVLLVPRSMVNNLRQIYCDEDCDQDAIFPDHTGTPVVTRKKRGIGAIFRAIASAARTGARATATGVRTAARATGSRIASVARRTATARRVLGKVATQVERGTLIYFIVDQANKLAQLQKEVITLRQQYANADSVSDKRRIVDELKGKREEAVDILASIDQISQDFEAENS